MRYVVGHFNLSYVCLMLLNASGTLKVAITLSVKLLASSSGMYSLLVGSHGHWIYCTLRYDKEKLSIQMCIDTYVRTYLNFTKS